MNMEVDSGSVKLSLCNELINDALNLSLKAHKHNQIYLTNTKIHGSLSSSTSDVLIIAFGGSWEDKEWCHDDHYGETYVDQILFPSLKRIGEDHLAKVNKAIQTKFQNLLKSTGFKAEVEKAVQEKKKILFTGHLYGGALASFGTLWMLDEYKRKRKLIFPIGCVTFGSPLIGDETLSHAVRREKWSGHFTHFVMEHDIIPRIMLAPKTSIQGIIPKILQNFQQNVNRTTQKPSKMARLFSRNKLEQTIDIDQLVKPDEAVAFFESVLINASSVASHDAYDLMEPTSTLKEKLSVDYVKISPYRPFGEYVFCTCDETGDASAPRQQLVVENPNAVLQLLFYLLQLPNENQDIAEFAVNSLFESLGYKDELNRKGLQLQNMVYLKDLNDKLWIPIETTDDTIPNPAGARYGTDDMVRKSNKALFELTASAKWCLMAVEEAEKRKQENENLIDTSMRNYRKKKTKDEPKVKDKEEPKAIEDILDEIRKYIDSPTNGKKDYYDAFFGQDEKGDFLANVNRLELAKIWDVIIEMVVRKDLPDEFEGRDEWVVLGTEFRRLVEPLDIANYYRHSKGEGTKPYMSVRPKRYKFTQRWHEHANVMEFESGSESNFVAEIEELIIEVETRKKKSREEIKEDLERIKNKVQKWSLAISDKNVFWGESVFSKLQEKLA